MSNFSVQHHWGFKLMGKIKIETFGRKKTFKEPIYKLSGTSGRTVQRSQQTSCASGKKKKTLPPLHIKLGLAKQLLKGSDFDSSALQFIQSTFPTLSAAKVTNGNGPPDSKNVKTTRIWRESQKSRKGFRAEIVYLITKMMMSKCCGAIMRWVVGCPFTLILIS